MDEISHTVILGPIDDFHHDAGIADRVTADEFYEFVMKACNVYPKNHFYLIGKGYGKFGPITPCKNVTIVPDHVPRIFRHEVSRGRSEEVPKFLSPVDVSPFTVQLEFLKSTEENVLFLYNDERLVRNSIEVAALVKTNRLDNRFFAKVNKLNMNNLEIEVLPDIFSPHSEFNRDVIEQFVSSMTSNTVKAFNNLILEGIDFVRFGLRAGYHLRKNVAPVPGWCLQVNGKWISLILSMFRIKTMSPDLDHRQEIVSYALYRETLLYASIAVLSNLVVKCGILTIEGIKRVFTQSNMTTIEEPEYLSKVYSDNISSKAWVSSVAWDAIRSSVFKNQF